MTISALKVASGLGLHAVFVVAAAVLATKYKRVPSVLILCTALALLAAALHWLLQSGMAPPRGNVWAGQMLALVLAGAVPLVATALTSRFMSGRGVSHLATLSVAAFVGLVLLIVLPSLQLALGCAFTGICL